MKERHLIWALAGGASLLILALAVWQDVGSSVQVSAPAPAVVQSDANQPRGAAPLTSGAVTRGMPAGEPVVPAAAPLARVAAPAPPPTPEETTEPSTNRDPNNLDPAALRDSAAQHSARAR